MIWKRCVLAVAMLLVMVNLTGCTSLRIAKAKVSNTFKKKGKNTPQEKQDQLVGIIEMVNPEQRFVLIRTESIHGLAAGTVLESRAANGGVTKLVVTPEKKQNFVSADFSEGFPLPGEMVVLTVAAQESKEASTSPATDATKTTPSAAPPVVHGAPVNPGEPIPGVPQVQ